ncbi:MAG: ATP-dependent helicase [Magnetococcales bacterium]|nr:ATP-dependent helicase [Magnetococcales bacterium]
MSDQFIADDNHLDDPVDDKIIQCLDMNVPKSFFMFAGAGSGKTRSLVHVLKTLLLNENRERHNNIDLDYQRYFRLRRQQIAVITYTNAARDEIKRRLQDNPLVSVSTIHSFVWILIQNHQSDIKKWLRYKLQEDIDDLKYKQSRGRAGKAARQRDRSIDSKQNRLNQLDSINRFTYSPDHNNTDKDALNHTEVIQICADFIKKNPLMQKILIAKFPILLVDESQDTNKHLMMALLYVQEHSVGPFCLGLIGDSMQQIYQDGVFNLNNKLLGDWERPTKKMNHRSQKRIVDLINSIRADDDGLEQKPRSDHPGEGIVRLFILPNNTQNKKAAEKKIAIEMASLSEDSSWSEDETGYKALTLEHHMAASRMGFLGMFEPLYQVKHLRTELIDGSLTELEFFTHQVLPLVTASNNKDEFAVMSVLRKHSPLLGKDNFTNQNGKEQKIQLIKAQYAVMHLMALFQEDTPPSFFKVLCCVASMALFPIPEKLKPFAVNNSEKQEISESSDSIDGKGLSRQEIELDGWDKLLKEPFCQIENYLDYVSGQGEFETHQGVKGLEFPRVMAIIDDLEERGFMFDYEKLFGVKELSETDKKNELEGKDTSVNRTRRLFYVICSRAEKSLAVVCYTESPSAVKNLVTEKGWFDPKEIVMM